MRGLTLVPGALALLLAACAGVSPGERPEAPTALLESPDTVWPGSRAVVFSLQFALDSAVILVNGDTTAASAVDAVRRGFALPESTGTYDIAVAWRSGDTSAAGRIVAGGGFEAWQPTGFVVQSVNLTPWPDPSGVVVVGLGPGGLLSLDLRSPATWDTLVADSIPLWCMYDAGAYGRWLAVPRCDAGGYIALERQGAALSAVDTITRAGFRGTFLGDGTWVLWTNREFWTRRNGAWSLLAAWHVGREVLTSADGSRVFPADGGSPDAMLPVWDRQTFAVAHALHGDFELVGARPSFAGDSVFLVLGDVGAPRNRLLSITASSGDTLAVGDTIPLPRWTYSHVVLDPAGPWLYLLGEATAAGPTVVVVDRRTMRIVHRLTTPADVPTPQVTSGGYSGYVDGAGRRLYVLLHGWGTGNRVYVFRLIP